MVGLSGEIPEGRDIVEREVRNLELKVATAVRGQYLIIFKAIRVAGVFIVGVEML